MSKPTRRDILLAAGAGAAFAGLPLPANATADTQRAAMAEIFGATPITPGRVKVEIPPLAENGLVVPLIVTVESPMTQANYVAAIHVFSEKNPSANVVHMRLSPHSGRAYVRLNIRLADAQTVTAVATMSDGSLWLGTADTIVTEGACSDGT